MEKVRVRFAPSPTGFLHIGGLRTALFNYLFAKKNKGEFLLRIEDTDQDRSREEHVGQIKETLTLFGIAPDNLENGEVIFQSKQKTTYQKSAQKLLSAGYAYECFCAETRLTQLREEQTLAKLPTKYDRHCLNLSDDEKRKSRDLGNKPVIRMKVPEGETAFDDIVYGHIKVDNSILDDQVLLKSDGFPTYHLANVIDDHAMGISHVIRGEEWIPSTPKHLILYQMFGWTPPAFAHLPLIVKPDHKKLSKRDRAAAASDYFDKFEINAILNYIAFLGWNPKTKQEIFTKEELVGQFELEKINRANPIFDTTKLNWINRQWVLRIAQEQSLKKTHFFKDYENFVKSNWPEAAENEKDEKWEEFLERIAYLILDRTKDFWELHILINTEFSFFFQRENVDYEPGLLLWKDTKKEKIQANLEKLKNFLLDPTSLKIVLTKAALEEKTKKFLAEQGIGAGEALWPLRVALSGLRASPGPFEILGAFYLLAQGAKIVNQRLQAAIDKLRKM